MKRIKLPGLNREIGIRMVKESALEPVPECVPQIEGLFTWDSEPEDWLSQGWMADCPGWSMIPVQLVGDTCGLPVTWRTEWTPQEEGAESPGFLDAGQMGIVFFDRASEDGVPGPTGQYAIPAGLVEIWATLAGVEYGPVSITLGILW